MASETSLGKVEITPHAIASIARNAALKSYGVVGLAGRGGVGELGQRLAGKGRRSIEVRISGDQIVIDIYVIIEYGTRISSVAHSIMNSVRFNVERAIGMPVAEVNVHVQGLRVSSPD